MAITDFMQSCVFMNKSKVSDGQGGFYTTWAEGASILVAFSNDTSMQARVAEKQGVTSTYTLTTTKLNALEFGDIIKRVSDGLYFRVTSDGTDKQTPTIAGLDMAQVKAERWTLTND